jgi:hypothetical protein
VQAHYFLWSPLRHPLDDRSSAPCRSSIVAFVSALTCGAFRRFLSDGLNLCRHSFDYLRNRGIVFSQADHLIVCNVGLTL